jgi:ParB-like chromosome segregation protein Spo0J
MMPSPAASLSGERFCKDLGDLRQLQESIADVGLLHPVVVTPQGKLIDGHRRVEAYRLLDWTAIPVHVVDLDHGQSCRVDVGTKVERGAC